MLKKLSTTINTYWHFGNGERYRQKISNLFCEWYTTNISKNWVIPHIGISIRVTCKELQYICCTAGFNWVNVGFSFLITSSICCGGCCHFVTAATVCARPAPLCSGLHVDAVWCFRLMLHFDTRICSKVSRVRDLHSWRILKWLLRVILAKMATRRLGL